MQIILKQQALYIIIYNTIICKSKSNPISSKLNINPDKFIPKT